MPFNRPTPQQLIERAATDIETHLGGADARLRRSNLNVFARVHALGMHTLYGFMDWVKRQILPSTCDSEELDEHALWRAGITRHAAVAATGTVTFTGTDGAVIAVGAELQNSDGAVYTTDEEAVIAAGVASVGVTAQETGEAGNVDAGAALSLISPIEGVTSNATVDAPGLTGGLDEESDEDFRARLLERIQAPPQGGAARDYVTWAREVPGVTRAWAYSNELGVGTVVVRFMTDDLTGNGIPEQAKVDEVQAYIDARRPVTADVTVVAPVAVPLDFTIALTPDSQAVRDEVEAELADLLRRVAEPAGTIRITHISEAISTAEGEEDHVLTAPAANVAHATGEIAVMGQIIWA